MKNNTRKVVICGLCLALSMLLPFLTGQIPQIGQMLAPMHLPVLLCGFLCGPLWGGIIGFIAPLLRFMLFQAPPLVPIGIPMMFELAAYGITAGVLYNYSKKKYRNIFIALFGAMLVGRIIWGIAMFLFSLLNGWAFTIPMFLTQAFVTALPGIFFQTLLIPPIIMVVGKRIQSYDR